MKNIIWRWFKGRKAFVEFLWLGNGATMDRTQELKSADFNLRARVLVAYSLLPISAIRD
jgi:hypothetical protein